MSRESFQRYREIMNAHGFRPSRRLGQNFLLDPDLHRILADSVAPQPEDLVLEVGAGLGFMTRELLQRCPVVAVEVDDRLQSILAKELKSYLVADGPLRLVSADILQGTALNPQVLAELEACQMRQSEGRFLLVANLPYAISGPFLAAILGSPRPPQAMAILVQYELAERLAAAPGGKEYGNLSVLLQSAYAVRILRRVGPQVFWPRPAVDSAMICCQPLEQGLLSWPAAQRQAFAAFLRKVFAMRRKKLRNSPALERWQDWLPAAQQEWLDRRPEQLQVAEMQVLFHAWQDFA